MTDIMISKRQRVGVAVSFAFLILCSVAAVSFASMYYRLAPMIMNDSSPEVAGKLSGEERAGIFVLVRSLLFQVSAALSLLSALWATLATVMTCLWITNSKRV